MGSNEPSPQRPVRSSWHTVLLFMVWLVGGLLAFVGLVFLGCGGACS